VSPEEREFLITIGSIDINTVTSVSVETRKKCGQALYQFVDGTIEPNRSTIRNDLAKLARRYQSLGIPTFTYAVEQALKRGHARETWYVHGILKQLDKQYRNAMQTSSQTHITEFIRTYLEPHNIRFRYCCDRNILYVGETSEAFKDSRVLEYLKRGIQSTFTIPLEIRQGVVL